MAVAVCVENSTTHSLGGENMAEQGTVRPDGWTEQAISHYSSNNWYPSKIDVGDTMYIYRGQYLYRYSSPTKTLSLVKFLPGQNFNSAGFSEEEVAVFSSTTFIPPTNEDYWDGIYAKPKYKLEVYGLENDSFYSYANLTGEYGSRYWRIGARAGLWGDYIYLFGGDETMIVRKDKNPGTNEPWWVIDEEASKEISVKRRVLRYNRRTGETQHLGERLVEDVRSSSYCVVYNGLMYLLGGESIHIFSPETNTVVRSIHVPSAYEPSTFSLHKGEIYVVNSAAETMIYNLSRSEWRTDWPFILGDKETINIDFSGVLNGSLEHLSLPTADRPKETSKVYYRDISTTRINAPQPSGGFVNEKEELQFSWEIVTVPEGASQHTALFQWRALGSTTVTSLRTGSNQYAVLPANTLPNGQFQWRVQATSTEGNTSEFTEWFTLTTIDQKHDKPTSLHPRANSYNGTKAIQLTWLCRSPLGADQKAFDIDISYDGVSWQSLAIKEQSSSSSFNVAGGTFIPTSRGRVSWRVRTYNTDWVVSDWSDIATFIVLIAPSAPEWVSVEQNRSRPICKWTADPGQTAWRLQVLMGSNIVYDTGEQLGIDTSHKIQDYIAPGQYVFRVQVKTIINIWSEYALRNVTISARSRVRVQIDGESIANGALITIVEKEVV